MIDKKAVANNFNRAAAGYDQYASIQHELAVRAFDSLKKSGRTFSRILEIGSGTGFLTDRLLKEFPEASITLVDLSPAMMDFCRNKYKDHKNVSYLVADGENLSLPGSSFDLIASSACFQWFHDTGSAMARFMDLLEDTGMLAFSTLGELTFMEMHRAFFKAYRELGRAYDAYHAQFLPSLDDWRGYLKGFSDTDLIEGKQTYYFDTVSEFFKSVKKVGAGNASASRAKAPLAAVRRMRDLYQSEYEGNRLPATYHFIYGSAVKHG